MRIAIVVGLLLLAACGVSTAPPLVATNVVITQPVAKMRMSAGYLSLTNNTSEAISISRVVSPDFESVMLHETTIEDGVARMRALPRLEIPGGGSVTLKRGGKHLMLMRPTGPVDTVTLQFFDDDDLILAVEAKLQGSDGQAPLT